MTHSKDFLDRASVSFEEAWLHAVAAHGLTEGEASEVRALALITMKDLDCLPLTAVSDAMKLYIPSTTAETVPPRHETTQGVQE